MNTVSFYYWAGARAAAQVESEVVSAESVAEALEKVRRSHADPLYNRVLDASSLLVDGLICSVKDRERPLLGPVRVEVLPPFAGGA